MRTPQELRIDETARVLTLRWPDGEIQRVTHARLRESCPCADCRRIRLAGGAPEAAEDLLLNVIEPMGYGVHLRFSDGHARGIYPWSWFEQLEREEAAWTPAT